MTGSRVNLEVDVLAKYTERLLAFSTGATAGTNDERRRPAGPGRGRRPGA
ncbi:riboflavin synthase subunit alpha [Arthrobacter sp. Hiyo4]|nr:riboflavin synthase subunit alpha [Arthrobacter sp. Hiyo4]